MTQLALDFVDPLADIQPIVADELARDALATAYVRLADSILVETRWRGERWVVDIGATRVVCSRDQGHWVCHPTAAYAHLFEAAA